MQIIPRHLPNTLFAESCVRALSPSNLRPRFRCGLMQMSLIGSRSKVQVTKRGSMPSCVHTRTKLPNPSVNADAPVHAGNLASTGGGAPVTLYR